jgi:hypothetical protein
MIVWQKLFYEEDENVFWKEPKGLRKTIHYWQSPYVMKMTTKQKNKEHLSLINF